MNAEVEPEKNFFPLFISLALKVWNVCKLKIVHLNVKQEIIHKHKTYALSSREESFKLHPI